MHRSIARFVVMLAVLLMPLSMAPAATAGHAMQGAMAMQHCPQPASSDKAKGATGECTMACASALPAADFARVGLSILPEQPAPAPVERWRDGIHPETATPPPKLA